MGRSLTTERAGTADPSGNESHTPSAMRARRRTPYHPHVSNVIDLTSWQPHSHRCPRREDAAALRVRVELADTAEPLWRRLDLASDLFLNDLHDVLQAAFGWTDSHLHRFASGESYYGPRTEYFLMPFEIEEGERGLPEERVRLDELLAQPGDSLFYCYDFGDDWQHVLRLEEVRPGMPAGSRAVCVDGEGPSPAEDCGGPHTYDLLVAANDPRHARHHQARTEYAEIVGEEVDPADYAPAPFDREAVNKELEQLGLDAPPVSDLPAPLAELLESVRLAPARRKLRRLLGAARLHDPVSVDTDTAARMTRPYRWLLNRVGADGIKLTAAGYLPPADVEAAVEELEIGETWLGKGNREIQTYPVLELRESAQRAGLLRKQKGTLSVTARGRKVTKDPVALWIHLAERTPPATRSASERQAGLLLLIAIAGGATGDIHAIVAEFLTAIGWATSHGAPLRSMDASYASSETADILHRIGGFESEPGYRRRRGPSADGIAFARAVLQRL